METPVLINKHRAKVVLAKASRSVRTLMGSVRMVYVGPRYPWVKKGHLLEAPGGLKLVLAEHHQGLRIRGLLGFQVTADVSAVESYVDVHPVTQMAGERRYRDPIKLPMAEYVADDDNELGFTAGVVLLVTGHLITKDWLLDGKRVHNVTQKLGVYFVEVAK